MQRNTGRRWFATALLMLGLALAACAAPGDSTDNDSSRQLPELAEVTVTAAPAEATVAASATPVPAVTWPAATPAVAFTLVPEVRLSPDGTVAPESGALVPAEIEVAPTVRAAATPDLEATIIAELRVATPELRYTCTNDFRDLLVGKHWEEAWEIAELLTDFRELRPDCVPPKFAPEFSQEKRCFSGDKISGGVYIPSHLGSLPGTTFFGGEGSIGESSMLIHFDRLPTSPNEGCWYYDAPRNRWGEGVVPPAPPDQPALRDGRPNPNYTPPPTGVPTPRPTPVPGLSYAVCDQELAARLPAEIPGHPDPELEILAVIDHVAEEFAHCRFGWGPELAWQRVVDYCPLERTGVDANGNLVLHWDFPPADGSSCWIYHAAVNEWEIR